MNTLSLGGETPSPPPPAMSLREINFAMAGLTIALFVAALSNLVVLTALPQIVGDLHGTQAAYTWIITASMLTMTVCMPIWGRMSDMLNKKRLIQLCVGGYVSASICAGSATAPWMLIVCRVAIGVCASGIIILMQAIAVDITTPRHRARWIGYRGAVMSFATVGAPTIGGFIVAHFGWRWCFFIAVPIAVVSIVMVQHTLRLAPRRSGRPPKIDWLGALLLAATTISILCWISLVAPRNGWLSPISLTSLAGGLVLLALAIRVERKAPHPMLPVDLFANREVLLCVIAGAATGFAFFGSAVFLAVFLQIGRGFSPEIAGLMAIPEAGATLLASIISSRFIALHGRYKLWLIVGSAMVTAGFLLLATVDTQTSLLFVGICVALIGGGLGAVAENLVLVVQTVVAPGAAGAAGAMVNFFRMMGGIVCVAALGALLSHHVVGFAHDHGLSGFDGTTVPKLSALLQWQRGVMEEAYASGVAALYRACVPVSLAMLLSVCLLPNRMLEKDPPAS